MTRQGAQETIGGLLREYRLAAGLTQEALAERAGISPRSVQTIESGTNIPFRETLRRLSTALDLSEAQREALSGIAQRAPRMNGAHESPSPVSRRTTPRPQFAALPRPPTPLLGREDEVTRLVELLNSGGVRLITLTGPGGVGKTRLALEVATALRATFGDAVAFIDLTPLTDPELVLPTIAAALGVVAAGGQPVLTSILHALEGKQCLLVLDNCEQVVKAAPAITTLVAGCPLLRVLATSRRPLRVRGERIVSLAPLSVPPTSDGADSPLLEAYAAVRLFIQQAQAAYAGFTLTAENGAAVAAICRHLDGLPLALELAAARVGVLPPRALAQRLTGTSVHTKLALLSDGARDLPARHQTLRDTIAWSYALLAPPEQALFRRLAVFNGGCTLEAIDEICGDNDDLPTPVAPHTLGALAVLVENNLLRMIEQPDGQPRYLLLETIRDYGREQLVAAGEAAILSARHAAYYLRFAEEVRPHLHSSEQKAWLPRLDQEIDNLRTAFGWCVEQGRAGDRAAIERGLWVVGSLLRYWMLRVRHHEGRMWLDQLLALPGASAPTLGRARALRVAGLMNPRNMAALGLTLCEESIVICRALGDRRELAHGLHICALMGINWPGVPVSSPAAYRAALEEAIDLYEQTDYPAGIAGALTTLTYADLYDGALDRAEGRATRALILAQEVGDRSYVSLALGALAEVARARGDLDRARDLLEQKLTVERSWDHWHYVWMTMVLLGEVAQEMGDETMAHACYQEAVRGFREGGDERLGLRALAGLALLEVQTGDLALGLRLAAATTQIAAVHPAAQARLDEVRKRAEQILGADATEALWQEGVRMTREQMFAATLGSPDRTDRIASLSSISTPGWLP